jgi:glutamine synthetase
MDPRNLRDFLEIPYGKLEELNLEALEIRESHKPRDYAKEKYIKYLKDEKRIKAVTICFSDMEGRLHLLDYDKHFFLGSSDNLTFDGSSIRGFSRLAESDLRLLPDWNSFRWLPSDIFGPGKVTIFGSIATQDGKPYYSDFRTTLQIYLEELKSKKDITVNGANEIEGFLMQGINAEQNFSEETGFELISQGGYYHALPQDQLRQFIDRVAEAKRAMGFQNEKDHPEVAPSQFELNYKYSNALNAADTILLYKLVCRQVANSMGMTATFLPKPIAGINGSGMHTNISLNKANKNIFYDKKGEEGLSKEAWSFIDNIMGSANDICLVLNSSVNAYRRLDPNFEAPNQIKVSGKDRGSMIRIPIGNEKSARIEVRSIGPDANPYLLYYTLIKAGLEGSPLPQEKDKRPRLRYLPSTINIALAQFKQSDFVTKILGEDNKKKYADLKQKVADRSPADLGNFVKKGEVIYHHEVTNQVLWNRF